jgi:hypothetical protein
MSPKPTPAEELIRRASNDTLQALERIADPEERALAARAAYGVVAELSKDLARHYRGAALAMKERSTNAAVAAKLGVSLHRLHLMLSRARAERDGADDTASADTELG